MKTRISAGGIVSRIFILILLILTFVPLFVMFNMSLKPNVLIKTDFWGLPTEPYWANFVKAFSFSFKPVLNSLIVCAISLVGIIINVSLAGYAFGCLKFKGKTILYNLVLAVMMIPYTLMIVPTYEIVTKMNLLNTYWSLIIPYISGQQIFGIIIAASYFQGLPKDLFEAAEIDGANEWGKFFIIALPLSKPILITVGITAVVAMYNDFIWPTVVLTSGDEIKTFCQIVFNNAAGKGSNDLGLIAAAFIIGTIPLVVSMASTLKYYIQGMMVGAVKG
ncbi:carbohydrate ABC transporter permease [Lachnoclostridium sp. Marseille-P6806]|uniref:carbohydrate ABC transporter permease n=1 Tax=Lachnoclostridium sp. Marseille-P6806 TaxID=2364793 RepID=UPI0010305060|nr:carbohydrate ABC transporter permease [Lachnoclostridium sp. Marseille-P6806]